MSEYTPHRSQTWKVLLNLFLLLLLIAGLVWGGFYFWSNRALEQQIAKSAALGFPMTLTEMNAWYVQPPGNEDATPFYTAVDPLLRRASLSPEKFELLPFLGQGDPISPTDPIPAESKQVMKEYLQAYADAGDLLMQGVQRKQVRFPIDFEHGYAMELPHLAILRQGCTLLEMAATVAADEGNAQQATDYVRASLRVGESLAEEPVLISQLVRIACHGISVEALRQTLNRATLTDDQLAALQAALAEVEQRDTFYRAFVGERAVGSFNFSMATYADISVSNSPSIWTEPAKGLYTVSGMAYLDQAFYLKSMDSLIGAAQAPIEQRMAASDRVQPAIDAAGPQYILSRILLPSLSRAVDENVRDVAALRCARAALAVERYRLAHGELPPSLQSLVGPYLDSVPNDPYTGQPLTYTVYDKGYVVYSFGQDRRDDNGLDRTEIKRQKLKIPGYDVSVRVER